MTNVIPFPRAKIVRLADVPKRTIQRGNLVIRCGSCKGTGHKHQWAAEGWLVPVIYDLPTGEEFQPACPMCEGVGFVR